MNVCPPPLKFQTQRSREKDACVSWSVSRISEGVEGRDGSVAQPFRRYARRAQSRSRSALRQEQEGPKAWNVFQEFSKTGLCIGRPRSLSLTVSCRNYGCKDRSLKRPRVRARMRRASRSIRDGGTIATIAATRAAQAAGRRQIMLSGWARRARKPLGNLLRCLTFQRLSDFLRVKRGVLEKSRQCL